MSEELILPKPRLYLRDVTEYYHKWLVGNCGGKIIDVYLYDAACHTFCCEITPSYACEYIETIPLTWDEETQEEVEEALREANVDTPPVSYFHARDLDRIEEKQEAEMSSWNSLGVPCIIKVQDTTEEEWKEHLEEYPEKHEAHANFMEVMREEVQANSRY